MLKVTEERKPLMLIQINFSGLCCNLLSSEFSLFKHLHLTWESIWPCTLQRSKLSMYFSLSDWVNLYIIILITPQAIFWYVVVCRSVFCESFNVTVHRIIILSSHLDSLLRSFLGFFSYLHLLSNQITRLWYLLFK